MNDSSADNWYRRFDTILLTPVSERTEGAAETYLRLEAFDDTVLGMPGRRYRRRRWCEDAFATERLVSELGRLPEASDAILPGRVRYWIQAQRDAELNAFQAAWWKHGQVLGGTGPRSGARQG